MSLWVVSDLGSRAWVGLVLGGSTVVTGPEMSSLALLLLVLLSTLMKPLLSGLDLFSQRPRLGL